MKRTVFILALSAIVFCSFSAYGASLTYQPESSYLTIARGSEDTMQLTVTLNDGGSGTHFLWFMDVMTPESNLPLEWITSSKSTTFLNTWWTSASATLTISVPEDADPGLYWGYLLSAAMRSHTYADAGTGTYIEVLVPSECESAPGFEISSAGPSTLWPPDHSLDEFRVEGKVLVPDGCNLFEIGYSIDDEYGDYSGTGTLETGLYNSFSAALPLEASRRGQDKDGRVYKVTIFAEDEAGITSTDEFVVLVPHDRRDK